MCQIHKFSHFLQRVHCVEVKSAVDVEMFTAFAWQRVEFIYRDPDSKCCTGHDARRRCSEYTMAVIFIPYLLGSASPTRASFLGSFGLNWLAGASILPDRPCAHVTSMASTENKFVITPLHGKYPLQGCNNIYLCFFISHSLRFVAAFLQHRISRLRSSLRRGFWMLCLP